MADMNALDDDEFDGQMTAAKKHKKWVSEIEQYERRASDWEAKADKIIKRYKDERDNRSNRLPRYNILWSNIETMKPALYARTPKPDIARRFDDQDDLGRVTSTVLERATSYFMGDKFDGPVKDAVFDRLTPGRGVVWVRYEPHFKDVALDETYGTGTSIADEGLEITDDAETYASGGSYGEGSGETSSGTVQVLDGEDVCFDYVHFKDFGHTWGRVWAEVDAAWRIVYMCRDKLRERFGDEIADELPLDYSPKETKGASDDNLERKATIYEIWDRETKTVLWVHKNYDKGPLDEKDDPLGLEGFFPFPRPLFSTLANDGCIPIPDYQQYQDQAAELDDLTGRIAAITKAVKVAGVYDATAKGIQRLLNSGVENTLIPVDQFGALSEKGGLGNVYSLLPTRDILQTLLGLYEARDKVKNDLYEITGMADILRGASNANETATAQQIKSQFGTLRLTSHQDDVQRFCRDLVAIAAQIIAKHFSLETLQAISGLNLFTEAEKMQLQMSQQQPAQQPGAMMMPPVQPPAIVQGKDQEQLAEMLNDPTWEQVLDLLRDNVMRSYKIDIETDSTLKFDQDAEQQSRVQFLTAVGGFLQNAVKVQDPALQPLMAEMLLFGVRGFKAGRPLESAFEVAIARMQKEAANPQPKPDPEMAKVQAQAQLQQQESQQAFQLEQAKLEADKQREQFKAQAEIARLNAQAQVDTNQSNLDAQLAREKAQQDDAREMAVAKMNNETKVIVAQIAAKTEMDKAALDANVQAYLKSIDAQVALAPAPEQPQTGAQV